MGLKITTKPRQSTKEVSLPSGGYAYGNLFPGGQIVVKAFDWESERLLFKSMDNKSKEVNRTVMLLKRICELPVGFDPMNFVEGDSAYLQLVARSLSYGEIYEFESICPQCAEIEKVKMSIPDSMPLNSYPEDFPGYLPVQTSLGEKVGLRFLTLGKDLEAYKLAVNRANANVIPREGIDDDYFLNRLAMEIAWVGDPSGTPDSLEEVRKWLLKLPVTEKTEIAQFLSSYAPGISYNIPLVCDHCDFRYKREMPVGPSFFRLDSRAVLLEQPRGVRIGVVGSDVRSQIVTGAGETLLPSNPGGVGEGESSDGGSSAS